MNPIQYPGELWPTLRCWTQQRNGNYLQPASKAHVKTSTYRSLILYRTWPWKISGPRLSPDHPPAAPCAAHSSNANSWLAHQRRVDWRQSSTAKSCHSIIWFWYEILWYPVYNIIQYCKIDIMGIWFCKKIQIVYVHKCSCCGRLYYEKQDHITSHSLCWMLQIAKTKKNCLLNASKMVN